MASNGSSSGFIRFKIDDIFDLSPSGRHSHTVEVLGLPWSLKVKRGYDHLKVYLFHRKSDSDMWSIDVSYEFCLINSDPRKNLIDKFSGTYNHEAPSWGTKKFIAWKDLVDEKKGFITCEEVIIEARFTPSNIVGIRQCPRFDFTDPNDPRHDVALVIEGEKVYTSKQFLAIHSPVFSSMFYGDFIEKNKKEITLNEIDRMDFIAMLNLMYPSHEKINVSNAESILKLADRFQIKVVIDLIEKFLIHSIKFDVLYKLNLSDQYRLLKLQEHCLDSFCSVDEIQDLKSMNNYKLLSQNMKATLLEKVMKLRYDY